MLRWTQPEHSFAAGIVAVLYGHTEPKLLTAMGKHVLRFAEEF